MNLIEFGMEKGRAVGREEGIKEGREEERADTVIRFLEDYGEVPEHVRELIVSEKDSDTLKRWVKLAARAASAEDFLDKIFTGN